MTSVKDKEHISVLYRAIEIASDMARGYHCEAVALEKENRDLKRIIEELH